MHLTHWGRATHICVGKLTTIGSDNGLSPGRRQAIISTIAGILLIWPLGRNFSEISIDIQTFSFKKIHFKMASAKWRPSCLGLNVLTSPNQLWPGELESWRVEYEHTLCVRKSMNSVFTVSRPEVPPVWNWIVINSLTYVFLTAKILLWQLTQNRKHDRAKMNLGCHAIYFRYFPRL